MGVGTLIPVGEQILQRLALGIAQLRVLIKESLQILAGVLLELLACGGQRDIADVVLSGSLRAQQITAYVVAPGLAHFRVLAEFFEQAERPHALNS